MKLIKLGLQHSADCLDGTEWHNLENNRELKSFLRQLKQKKLGIHTINLIIQSLNKLTGCGLLKSLH